MVNSIIGDVYRLPTEHPRFGTYGTLSADVHVGARCCAPSCTNPQYLADLRKESGSEMVRERSRTRS